MSVDRSQAASRAENYLRSDNMIPPNLIPRNNIDAAHAHIHMTIFKCPFLETVDPSLPVTRHIRTEKLPGFKQQNI